MKNIKKNGYQEWKAVVKKDFQRNKSVYLMLVFPIIFYILFKFVPMYGLIIAFQNYRPRLGITGSSFVGFKHFATFLRSPSFLQVLFNTLRISVVSILFAFPAPIVLALLFNEITNKKFAKVVQTVSYMPHFISLVVICGMITSFTLDTGVVTQALGYFGFEPKTLLSYAKYFIPVYVLSDIWQNVGWGSIIYLAALTSIDPCLYEAARVDGANRWKQTIHITLPGISSTIVVLLILRVGGVLNVGFEKIILLYNDATMRVADVISTYVYRKGLLEQNWSFSSAVGMMNSLVNFLILIGVNAICKKINDTSLW